MNRPKYVASCSGGKDSVATLLLAVQHNEPLDEAVFSEVMFDQDTSGEVPEHRDFIYDRLKPSAKRSWASSLPFFMQTRPTIMCSIMSSPADLIRARFAVLRGPGCARSIGIAKSRQSASSMLRFLRIP